MKKILVIEDDQYINSMICDLLKQNFYEVISAFSGTEGLLCFENYKFDLIILDLMLPGKSGDEVLEKIREKSDVPIIVLTAISEKESMITVLKNGANDYIKKSFDNEEFIVK